jgi:hypothetical protein
MRVTTEEDRPNCARSKRGAGFSRRDRGVPLSAPDTPRAVKPSVLCMPQSESIGKGRCCLCRGPGEVSPPVAISPPKSTSRPINVSASHLESSPGLEYGVRPTHARKRTIADSQDPRRLSNATAGHMVGSPKRTIDVVCTELGKLNAEMPSRPTEVGYSISSGGASAPRGAASPPPLNSGGASAPRGAASPPTSLFSWRICLKVFPRRAA